MKSPHSFRRLAIACFALLLFGTTGRPAALAQMMDHHHEGTPSTQLTLHGLEGKSISLTPEDFAALPHKTVSVFNSHTKANENYSGVALTDLLAKVNVPQAR